MTILVGPGGECYCCSTCTEAPVCNIELVGTDAPGNTITINWFVSNATSVSVTDGDGDVISTNRIGSLQFDVTLSTCERIQIIATNDCGTTICRRVFGPCFNCTCPPSNTKSDLAFNLEFQSYGIPALHECEIFYNIFTGGSWQPRSAKLTATGFDCINGVFDFDIKNGLVSFRDTDCNHVALGSPFCRRITSPIWTAATCSSCVPAYYLFLGSGTYQVVFGLNTVDQFTNTFEYDMYLMHSGTPGGLVLNVPAAAGADPTAWCVSGSEFMNGTNDLTSRGPLSGGASTFPWIMCINRAVGLDNRHRVIALQPTGNTCPSDTGETAYSGSGTGEFSPFSCDNVSVAPCGTNCGDIISPVGTGDLTDQFLRWYWRTRVISS